MASNSSALCRLNNLYSSLVCKDRSWEGMEESDILKKGVPRMLVTKMAARSRF